MDSGIRRLICQYSLETVYLRKIRCILTFSYNTRFKLVGGICKISAVNLFKYFLRFSLGILSDFPNWGARTVTEKL